MPTKIKIVHRQEIEKLDMGRFEAEEISPNICDSRDLMIEELAKKMNEIISALNDYKFTD